MTSIPLIPHENLSILRGDMVPGGAKMPALLRYLPRVQESSGTQHFTPHFAPHFAYVGTVFGSGGWAVAESCAHLGYDCSLFLANAKHKPDWINRLFHLRTNIYWEKPEPVDMIYARVAKQHPDLSLLPLGFDTPEFISVMADTLRESLPTPPTEIWVPALSGVLARAACAAFPDSPVHAVSAVKHVGDIGRAILHSAPEKFHIPARYPPPYPACPYSDAKLWQFVTKQAIPGAVIINVGYQLSTHDDANGPEQIK